MDKGKMLAGVDAGHVRTKAVVMRGEEILGYAAVPTGFDAGAAAEEALTRALESAGVARGDLAEIAGTGIFRERIKGPPVHGGASVPDYVAGASGALFLDRHSRTVIDMGGNIHKAVRYDEKGNVLDVIQNDKCADGLGIFFTTMAKAIGLSEREMSELALESTRKLSVAIQCALSAESEAVDLLCQGMEPADVADAVLRFIVERVGAMCASMPLAEGIVAAGGLAKSQVLMAHLQGLLKRDIKALDLPEYVGAIGAVVSCEGGI